MHSFNVFIGGAPGAPPGISLVFKTSGITGLSKTKKQTKLIFQFPRISLFLVI
jgi:hypothetical protein